MKLTIVSHFRNASTYIDRYLAKVELLSTLLEEQGDELTVVLGYGDSVDDTDKKLKSRFRKKFNSIVIDVSHGGPNFGSVVHPIRFKQLAQVANLLWVELPEDQDFVCLIESDLDWQPEVILGLMESHQSLVSTHKCPILLAPMIKASESVFYDTWAFRNQGKQFQNAKPFHVCLNTDERFIEMDSVGSVVLLDGATAEELIWPEKDVVVGFCRAAKSLGAKVFLDTELEVFHS